jgi:hypothetical protein
MKFVGEDTKLFQGGVYNKTYKAGRSKLLASENVTAAANINDKYVYFAMSRYMGKTIGTYPMYPSKWDGTLTFEKNIKAESNRPAHASSFSTALNVVEDDSIMGGEAVPTSEPYDISNYPDWYQTSPKS